MLAQVLNLNYGTINHVHISNPVEVVDLREVQEMLNYAYPESAGPVRREVVEVRQVSPEAPPALPEAASPPALPPAPVRALNAFCKASLAALAVAFTAALVYVALV